MSTSDDEPTRPLTRRELRELRAQGGESAVRAALDAEKARSADDASDRTQASAAEPPREPNVVATSSPDTGSPLPLTRKELRRLRTNEVPIISPEQADARETSTESGVEEASASSAEQEMQPAEGSDTSSTSDRDVAESSDADESADAAERLTARDDLAEDATVDHAVLEPTTSSTEIPTLNPSFGSGVAERTGDRAGPTSFDALMEQQYTQTSPSSIIMTSSLALPEGIGSTGAAKGTTDGRDADAVLIDGELPPSSSPTPIAASAAISTQKSAHEVIRPPSPDKGRGVLLMLGITAGVLGIVAIGTLATLYFTGVFNQ